MWARHMIVCTLKETRGEVSLARLVVQFAYLAAGVRRVFCAASVRLGIYRINREYYSDVKV